MQAHLLLSSLFSFLFIFFNLPTSASHDYEWFASCAPAEFSCGGRNFTVGYPFGFDGRPKVCYVPGHTFTCQNGSLALEMSSGAYVVKEINYEEDILTIVKKEFMGQTWLLSDTTINYNLFNYTNQVRNLTLYYNCTTPTSPPSGFYDLPFLNSTGFKNAYFTTMSKFDVPDSLKTCNVSLISVSQMGVDRVEGDRMVFVEMLRGGFNVTWAVGREWCDECESSGGRCGYNASSRLAPVCFCKGGFHTASCPDIVGEDGIKWRNKRTIIGATAGIGASMLTCLFYIIFRALYSDSLYPIRKFSFHKQSFSSKRKADDAYNVEQFLMNYYGSLTLKRYRYSDIKKITNSFKDKLGQGGYAHVFKGKLFDGRLVAVKVLKESKGSGEEFINEVASIGRTYHINVVPLLGFCSEGSKRALIYEFMPNGSLEKFIYAEKPKAGHPLGWKNLHDIALGIARGLDYLHRGCTTRILHFDIKPHNILLDQDFCPKISDFGLAKLCPTKESIVSMLGARGTVGYIAPEVFYRNIGGVSYKSDVYSYGMMMLEMVGGRKNIDAQIENSSEMYFPQWVYKRLDLHEDLGLCGVGTKAEEEIAKKMIMIGMWCIQTNPTNRPSMGRVIEMLEGSLESLQMPPNPFPSAPPDDGSIRLTLSV